jgi:hypothetical protein
MKLKAAFVAASLALTSLGLASLTPPAPASAAVVVVGVHPGHYCYHHACYRYHWNGGYYNYYWHGGYYNYYWHGRYYHNHWRCGPRWCYR